ncbi:type II toxin-antitoxin system VapC family toxin [soil metagenome]
MPPAERPDVVVLDASVAVRWIVDEEGSTEAVALLELDISWVAPRLMLTEVASALRRKAVDGAIPATLAAQALDTLMQAIADGVVRLADDERIVQQALLLALSLGHKVPDCLYLAVAEREGAAIATADDRLARFARQRRIPVLPVPHA